MEPKTHFKLVRTGGHCHYGKPVATGDAIEAPVGVAREMLALEGEWKLAPGEPEIPPAPVEPEPELVQTSAQADATHEPHAARKRSHK